MILFITILCVHRIVGSSAPSRILNLFIYCENESLKTIGEKSSKPFLFQSLSINLQRGNALWRGISKWKLKTREIYPLFLENMAIGRSENPGGGRRRVPAPPTPSVFTALEKVNTFSSFHEKRKMKGRIAREWYFAKV